MFSKPFYSLFCLRYLITCSMYFPYAYFSLDVVEEFALIGLRILLKLDGGFSCNYLIADKTCINRRNDSEIENHL